MRVAAMTYAACVRASSDLDRALARFSALDVAWRWRHTHPPTVGEHELHRRVTIARVRLHEAIAASTRATARDTRWTLAMRRARRALRVRK